MKFKFNMNNLFLPAYVISRKPNIVICFWGDFLKYQDRFFNAMKNKKKVYVLFQLGWAPAAEESLKQIENNLNILKNKFHMVEFVFMINDRNDALYFDKYDLKTFFCHQNAFIDEARITPIKQKKKEFEAVYLARVTPFKRHRLSRKLLKVLYIGDYKKTESSYAKEVMQLLNVKLWLRKVRYYQLSRYLSKAMVGLCLSRIEGAMFASTEYQLAGLPVVSTRSEGGREALFNNKYCTVVEEDENKIEAEVMRFIIRDYDPGEVRKSVLKKMIRHREIFIDYINDIYIKEGIPFNRKRSWRAMFVHKWGLRSFVVSPKFFINRIWSF